MCYNSIQSNQFSYIVTGYEYPQSLLPEITCKAEVSGTACVLASFTSDSIKRGVDSIDNEMRLLTQSIAVQSFCLEKLWLLQWWHFVCSLTMQSRLYEVPHVWRKVH